jgi:hypothetical protein
LLGAEGAFSVMRGFIGIVERLNCALRPFPGSRGLLNKRLGANPRGLASHSSFQLFSFSAF